MRASDYMLRRDIHAGGVRLGRYVPSKLPDDVFVTSELPLGLWPHWPATENFHIRKFFQSS